MSFPCTVTSDVKTELFCVDNGDGLFKCQNPAVKKSGLWNWKPVCQQCEDYLKAKQGEQVKLVKPTAEQEAANKEAKDKEDAEIAQAKENAEPEKPKVENQKEVSDGTKGEAMATGGDKENNNTNINANKTDPPRNVMAEI